MPIKAGSIKASPIKASPIKASPIKASPTKNTRRTPNSIAKKKQQEIETEEKLDKIRRTPVIDRYGRAHYNGTPIGSGDKAWRLQHGIGAKYSRQCSMLGIGISRDSFLPSECKVNDKSAMRDTPRSTKLSNETYKWARKYGFDKNEQFMKQLRFVQKRVVSVDNLPVELTELQKQELFQCVYKIANYSLQDKRQPAPPMGTATREQMLKAQLWLGDISASSSDVFYFPSYKATDKRLPRTVFGPPNQQDWIMKRKKEEARSKEEASARTPHWSENTEMPQTMGTPNVDARIPTAPAFTFGTSERPPINGAQALVSPPIYNVPFENDPRFLPRYKTFGANYRSMGYGEQSKNRTKSRRPKSTEWGAPMPEPHVGKVKSPTRFGLILTPKVSYAKYKLFG